MHSSDARLFSQSFYILPLPNPISHSSAFFGRSIVFFPQAAFQLYFWYIFQANSLELDLPQLASRLFRILTERKHTIILIP